MFSCSMLSNGAGMIRRELTMILRPQRSAPMRCHTDLLLLVLVAAGLGTPFHSAAMTDMTTSRRE